MTGILQEIGIVLILIVVNGFFSMSEIALISVRKTRIQNLVKNHNSRAKIVQLLHSDPENLFATTQIGISLVTILASAFAGSNLSSDLSNLVSQININFVVVHAETLSFVFVVLAVTFVSMSIGELVPKSLGLRYAENLALLSAYPIWGLSKISYPLIKILKFWTNLILKPFKDSANFVESRLSKEELRVLVDEAQKTGAIKSHERNIISNVFATSNLTVGRIMMPRTQITSLDIDQPARENIDIAIASGFSRIPVYQNNFNNIVGILYTKKLLEAIKSGLPENLNLKQYLIPAYFVPDTMKIGEVLQRMQRKKSHMTMVTNEHGEIEGAVTLEDIFEEIVGEIADETDEPEKLFLQQADGSYVVSGEISVLDFNRFFSSQIPETGDFTTLSGFVIHKLGRFPQENDKVLEGNFEFVVKEKTLRTVKTLAVRIATTVSFD